MLGAVRARMLLSKFRWCLPPRALGMASWCKFSPAGTNQVDALLGQQGVLLTRVRRKARCSLAALLPRCASAKVGYPVIGLSRPPKHAARRSPLTTAKHWQSNLCLRIYGNCLRLRKNLWKQTAAGFVSLSVRTDMYTHSCMKFKEGLRCKPQSLFIFRELKFYFSILIL